MDNNYLETRRKQLEEALEKLNSSYRLEKSAIQRQLNYINVCEVEGHNFLAWEIQTSVGTTVNTKSAIERIKNMLNYAHHYIDREYGQVVYYYISRYIRMCSRCGFTLSLEFSAENKELVEKENEEMIYRLKIEKQL